MPLRALPVVVLLTLFLWSSEAHAGLAKYAIRNASIADFNSGSPRLTITPFSGVGTSVIDNDGGSLSPIAKKLVIVAGGQAGRTIDASTLSGFIWLKDNTREGPQTAQTGSGSVDSNIDWGIMTGWTITGGKFCHAVPSYICTLAMRVDTDTVAPFLPSSQYDVHDWTFHATGFVGTPFVRFTDVSGGFGNQQYRLRGVRVYDGTVPAMPILAIAAVGASLLAAGVGFARRPKP